MDANIRRDGEELFHRKVTTEHAVPRASENDKLRGESQWVLTKTQTKEEKWGDAFRGRANS